MGRLIDIKVREKALNYFFNNDVTYEATVSKYKGAFSLNTLMRWCKSDERFVSKRLQWTYYDADTKEKAIMMYNVDKKTIRQIQDELGIKSASSITTWIKQYEKYGKDSIMPKRKEEKLKPPKDGNEKDAELYQLKLENDILREAFLLGDYPKGKGFKVEDLTVSQKTKIVLSRCQNTYI
jgi:transposase-like protein